MALSIIVIINVIVNEYGFQLAEASSFDGFAICFLHVHRKIDPSVSELNFTANL